MACKAAFQRLAYILFIFVTSCRSKDHDWPVYKADALSSSYSDLRRIDKGNVRSLKPVWTFDPGDAPPGARPGNSECNPIVIDGIMYTASARHRVYAIDATNGKKLWSFDPFDGGPGGGVCRGVTYWEDGEDKRILFTGGDILFALNARTGRPITSFGKAGKVSMNIGIRDDPGSISIKPTSPGIVYRDLLIIGNEVSELYGAQPGYIRDDPGSISIKPTSPGIVYRDLLIIGNEVSELYGAQPGYIRAYNIRTGWLEWTFHTIPKPGEYGYDTWPAEAWKYAGGANDWSGMSLDEKRGMVFLALGSPSYDFYGADRKGQNLFGNCIVALDAATGKRIWHFQTVHHDLWDYDLPAPPNLVTIKKDGRSIDAVAQTSKAGFLYVLDRETGTPLFPIEERKVPASDVPGEEAWPTQPFPLKPAPYARQSMTEDDLADFSPASHDSLVTAFRSLRYEGLFTPPSTRGTLNLPGTIGGSEWGGAAYDPATGILYLKSNNSPEIDQLKKIEPAATTADPSSADAGRTIYLSYCASCHKEDRDGDEPLYPSLIGLGKRMTREQVIGKIRQGGGKMPPFAGVLQHGKEDAIATYLLAADDKKFRQQEADLAEIKQNRKALSGAKSAAADTAFTYLNVLAYAPFRGAGNYPAIKPPWGTLNAIDLNTGEYVWQIPVGNDSVLAKKNGQPTGLTGSPGPMVTAGGLVFIAGGKDKKLHAFDKTNGTLLWEVQLPGMGSSTPCTYMIDKKQYIALSVAGDKQHPAGTIMAFALP